jgi:hypothetical protein
MLGVGGNRQHGIGGGLEEEIVDYGLVLVGNGSDLGGQREDDVKVGDLEELGLALLHPRKCLTALALRAMTVATAAVGDDGMATLGVLAACDIAAKRCRAAGLDRAHDLQLCVAHVAAVGVTPSGTEVAEDVRDFQSGTLHESNGLLRRIRFGPQWRERIERARDFVQYFGGDGRIDRRRFQFGVTHRARVIMHVLLTH